MNSADTQEAPTKLLRSLHRPAMFTFRGRFLPSLAITFACLALLFFSVSFLQSPAPWTQRGVDALDHFRGAETIPPASPPASNPTPCSPVVVDVADQWASERFLKGEPTLKAKDNLLNDTHYITTFSNAGFTNQFMIYVNMIYLGLLSDRIPIMPPFVPDHHVSTQAGALPFGQVFNLSRAREALRTPLLEWHDVKVLPDPMSVAPPPSSEREHLGCWSTKPENDPNALRLETIVDNLRLDISYTRVPQEGRRDERDHKDNFIDINHLVPYIYPRNPIHPPDYFPVMDPSPMGHWSVPDEQLSCFDQLYYATSSLSIYEWRFAWSPAWRFVAKHLYFTDYLYDLSKAYLARAFKIPDGHLPPFIAVHKRHGDFKNQCFDGRPKEECLIPLSKFQKEVDRIRDEIRQKRNIEVDRVVVMSDEKDQAFWNDVESMGWTRFDHAKEMTLEKYGEWMGPVLDQVAQSLAVGFVGTEDSTFSLVSMRRVQDWNHGPALLLERDPYHAE